jgi:hypothetical protein
MEQNNPTIVNLTPELRLEQAIKEASIDNPSSIVKLIINGLITENDCMFIYKNLDKTLQELDMSGASFENNTIPIYGFTECKRLTAVTIPDSVVEFVYKAFAGCENLISVIIPDSVREMGAETFHGCTSLQSVHISSSATYIGFQSFKECVNLKSVIIPNSVDYIDHCAFYGCSGLTSINISDSVTEIGAKAFYDCTALTSVTIPCSVVKIGRCTFKGCTAHITVHPDNPVYKSVNGKLKRKRKIIEEFEKFASY